MIIIEKKSYLVNNTQTDICKKHTKIQTKIFKNMDHTTSYHVTDKVKKTQNKKNLWTKSSN